MIPSQEGLFEMKSGVRRGLEGRRPRDAGCWPHRTICRAQDKRDPVGYPFRGSGHPVEAVERRPHEAATAGTVPTAR